MRLGSSGGHSWPDQHGGCLQRVVAAPPGLPEDSFLSLVSLSGYGVEVLAVEVGMSTGAKPPATCRDGEPEGKEQARSDET